jgi:hypothetical protein
VFSVFTRGLDRPSSLIYLKRSHYTFTIDTLLIPWQFPRFVPKDGSHLDPTPRRGWDLNLRRRQTKHSIELHLYTWYIMDRKHHPSVISLYPSVISNHPSVNSHHLSVNSHHPSVNSHHPSVNSHHPSVNSHFTYIRSI